MSTEDLSITQAVAYSVLYALDAEAGAPWKAWAHIWLKGDDRTAASAQMAAGGATTNAAKAASNAARLLADATQLHTEAAMLMAENRNASWQLDQVELRNEQVLAAVADSIRQGSTDGTLDTQSPRAAEIRARVRKEF